MHPNESEVGFALRPISVALNYRPGSISVALPTDYDKVSSAEQGYYLLIYLEICFVIVSSSLIWSQLSPYSVEENAHLTGINPS